MTISLSNNAARVSYSVSEGATQSSFTVSFEFFDDDDLSLYVDGTLKTLTTHYTVSGGNGSTGTITMTSGNNVTGISGGSTVVITRDIDLDRVTDFPSSGPFAVATLNTELDRFTAIAADQKDEVDRALRLQDFDSAVSMTLPLKAARLGTVLGFNASTGAPEAGPTIANVNSLSAITTNINTVAGISSNVTTVAGISSNVTTVAGIASNVTSVAGNASNINAAVSNASNINTVASNISNVNAVGAKSSLITSDFVSDLNTLAVTDVINDINTLATSDIVSDLNTLATSDIVSDLNTLATSDIVSDINTLATADIVSDLNQLATSDFVSDLNTMATTTNVNNLGTVAGAVSNVNTVAGIASDVTTVAGISSDVAAVENVAANVTTVAGIASNVTTVAGASSNVSTVAGAITNVNNVGGSIANVNTVASNLSGVNSFAERYRVASSDPSSNNDEGDLVYNTTDNNLKFFNGSAFVSVGGAISNIVEDTTPQLGGDLQSNGNDIDFADNDKATFGNIADLQIYHDGSNSYIDEAGEGILNIRGNTGVAIAKYTGEAIAEFTADGAVTLRHDNSIKFATTSTGVSVTGGLNTTGNVGIGTSPAYPLDVSGSTNVAAFRSSGSNSLVHLPNSGSSGGDNSVSIASVNNDFYIRAGDAERMRIDSSGNLLVGTTTNDIYDSSSEVGSQISDGYLAVARASTVAYFNRLTSDGEIVSFRKGGSTVGSIGIQSSGFFIDGESGHEGIRFANGAITPRENGSDSDGASDLGASNNRFKDGYFSNGILARYHYNLDDPDTYIDFATGNLIKFFTGGSERARFLSSGNFLLGKTAENIGTAGVELGASGYVQATRSGSTALYLNRTTNTGTIALFQQASNTKGSIDVAAAGTTYNTTSDIRLKQDIEPLVATDKLMQMNPVSYNWKADPDGPRSMGFIAQEMQEVMPEAVSTGEDDDMMSMDYGRITPILVSALQDAHKKIEELESRIAAMESK